MHLCTISRGLMSAALVTVLGGRFPGEVEHAGAVNFHSDSSLDLIGRVFYTNTEIAEKSGTPRHTDRRIQEIPRIGDLPGARVGRWLRDL